VFLIAIGVSFFAKSGDQFSRAWLGSFYVLGLFALIAFRRVLFLLLRRWTREGRLARRTVVVGADANGESLIRSLAAQRDSDVHVVGVFDDHATNAARRAAAACPSSAASTTSSPSPATPGSICDLLAADLRGTPAAADAEEALGAPGRHPPLRAQQQAALPPALLLLHRRRSGARHLRQAHRRLGR
jgi:hypothetical protein